MPSADITRRIAISAVAATASLIAVEQAPSAADDAVVAAEPNLSWCDVGHACYFQRSGQTGNYNLVRAIAGPGDVNYVQSELAMNNGTTGKRACGYRTVQPGVKEFRTSVGWHQIRTYTLNVFDYHKWIDGTQSCL
jgi:hypothetical protein